MTTGANMTCPVASGLNSQYVTVAGRVKALTIANNF